MHLPPGSRERVWIPEPRSARAGSLVPYGLPLFPPPANDRALGANYDEGVDDHTDAHQPPEADADIASAAALMGDPTRAKILMALMGGRERPASELARLACVSPQTASAHLHKLQLGGLVAVRRRGRYRFYRLSGPEVAAVIESLQNLRGSTANHEFVDARGTSFDMRFARTCYDHLAGKVAVATTDALVERGAIEASGGEYSVSTAGTEILGRFGIDVIALSTQRRSLIRPCPDWTERRPHLGGAVGAALLRRLLDLSWVVNLEGSRVVHLTPKGLEGLRRAFGVGL